MDEFHICRTCGYYDEKEPFYKSYGDKIYPTYNICVCCFSEAGYDDGKGFREIWLKKGALFYEETQQPKDWSYKKALVQIKNIPEKYLNQTSENL